MSLKSSKKIVFSPATNSIGVDFNSGSPPGSADAAGCIDALDEGASAGADAGGALAAAAGAPAGTLGARLERSAPPFAFTERPSVAPAPSWKFDPCAVIWIEGGVSLVLAASDASPTTSPEVPPISPPKLLPHFEPWLAALPATVLALRATPCSSTPA